MPSPLLQTLAKELLPASAHQPYPRRWRSTCDLVNSEEEERESPGLHRSGSLPQLSPQEESGESQYPPPSSFSIEEITAFCFISTYHWLQVGCNWWIIVVITETKDIIPKNINTALWNLGNCLSTEILTSMQDRHFIYLTYAVNLWHFRSFSLGEARQM